MRSSVLGVPYGAGFGVWCGGINESVVCSMTREYTT